MFVYLNKHIVPAAEAKVSVLDRGLQYGDGFFETIRVEAGYVFFLSEHLDRLRSSCVSFNIQLPVRDWHRIIIELLDQNGLRESLAAVKILVTRGATPGGLDLERPEEPTVVIYARPYFPPDEKKYKEGSALVTFPHRRHGFLAAHKCANYLFYLAARDWARRQKADEAIILNGDGSVSECATANIFYRQGEAVCVPQSPHYLVGVTEEQVKSILRKMGFPVSSVPTTVEDLLAADEVFVTNSLIGVMPMSRVDGITIGSPQELELPGRLQTQLFTGTAQKPNNRTQNSL
jgi:para-aminobenzoate synthetase component 1